MTQHPICVWEVWEVTRRFSCNRRWPRPSDARSSRCRRNPRIRPLAHIKPINSLHKRVSAGSPAHLKHFILQSCRYSSAHGWAHGRARGLTLAIKATLATIQRLLRGTTSIINSYFHTDKQYYFPKGFDGFVFNNAAQFGSRLSIQEGCGCFSSLKHRHLSSQLAHSMSFSLSDCCTTTVRMPGFEWRWKGTAWKCVEANSILSRGAELPPRAPSLQPRWFKLKQMLLKENAKQPGNTCELILVLLQQTESQEMIKSII